jgi:hypothetical protein
MPAVAAPIMMAMTSLGSGYAESQALRAQGAYQKQLNDTNANLADIQAKDSIRRGNIEASKVKREQERLIGEERVTAAASGVDVNQGSAADVQDDTKALSDHDIITIRNNAFREAWGYNVQADDYRYRGRFAESAANFKAGQAMTTGILNALAFGMQAYAKGTEKKADLKDLPTYSSYGKTTSSGSSQVYTGGGYSSSWKPGYGSSWNPQGLVSER